MAHNSVLPTIHIFIEKFHKPIQQSCITHGQFSIFTIFTLQNIKQVLVVI